MSGPRARSASTSSSRARSRCSRPALGMASGGATAIGAAPREPWSWWLVIYPLLGALMAAVLNAASNGLNQIYDFDIDAVNKPKRPLPSGRMTHARGVGVHVGHVRRRLAARLARRARRPARVLLARRRRHAHHDALLGAAVPHQAARHLGERDGGRPARRAAEGRRLVVGEDGGRPRAVVHRHDLRAVPARRDDDQGLRRHGRRRAGRVPHAADPVRRHGARPG